MDILNLSDKERQELIDTPDEELEKYAFSVPWQYSNTEGSATDADGYRSFHGRELTLPQLQEELWTKFHRNPWINTAVRRMMGRLTGLGFAVTSDQMEIQTVIDELWYDYRNRLYLNMSKYFARSEIEGELFLVLTCHPNGFIEVDFMDPSNISSSGKGGSGIIYHPRKTQLPLFYTIEYKDPEDPLSIYPVTEQIPSVFIARNPSLVEVAAKNVTYSLELQKNSRNAGQKFKKLGGFNRFIVNWDRSYLTDRAVSHMRTTLEWIEYYETLKKYEMDYKKSAASYLWVITVEDSRSFKNWLTLSDSDRAKTGIMAKKTPGSTLVLPPGMKMQAMNPNLPKLTNEDADLLQMVSSGLNLNNDEMTGSLQSTYASAKAAKGPASDRISDEIAYFERFLRYDFFGNLFFLRSKLSSFPEQFKVREAIRFDKQGEPVFKNVVKAPEHLIDINFPTTENMDREAVARALLGSKHGSVIDTLGIPPSTVAKLLGLSGYGRLRLQQATEEDKYPQLVLTVDAESVQERREAEPSRQAIKEKQDSTKKDATKKDA